MLGRIGIPTKLVLGVIASCIGFVAVAGVALSFLRSSMLEDRYTKVRSLTEAARGIATHFQQRAAKGEFDEAQAKAATLAVLRGLRYEGEEYFFVYDDTGTVLLNPTRPDREGKNFIDGTDADGMPYVRRMIEAAAKGGGRVAYRFTKPGSTILRRRYPMPSASHLGVGPSAPASMSMT